MKKVAGTWTCSSNPSKRGTPTRGPYSHCDMSVRRLANAGSSLSAVVSPSTSKQSIAAQRWPLGQTKRGSGREGRLLAFITSLREFDDRQLLLLLFGGRAVDEFVQPVLHRQELGCQHLSSTRSKE